MDRISKLRAEYQQLDDQKGDIEKAINDRKSEEISRLIPEIERFQKLKIDMKNQIESNKETIKNEEGKIETLKDKIEGLEKHKEEKKE